MHKKKISFLTEDTALECLGAAGISLKISDDKAVIATSLSEQVLFMLFYTL